MIPLPPELEGVPLERTIRIDRALLYLITAALSSLLDGDYQQTGVLTVEDAISELWAMFDDYLDQP